MHILLDAPLYSDIQPFFPLNFNPFLNASGTPEITIYLFCTYCFIAAIILYFIRLVTKFKNKSNKKIKKTLVNTYLRSFFFLIIKKLTIATELTATIIKIR